jgi:hypothetical protein
MTLGYPTTQALALRGSPRKVQRRPAIYPHLKGDRQAARQEVLNQFLIDPISYLSLEFE